MRVPRNLHKPLNWIRAVLIAATMLALSSKAMAQTIAPPVTIVGDVATASFNITSALTSNTYHVEFRLEFDDPQNLSQTCLGLTATVLDGALLTAVTARLPVSPGLSIDAAFPVMVSVTPPVSCNSGPGLSFRNEVKVDFYTTNLNYLPIGFTQTPYRLYKAPANGTFFNLTAGTASGSYRARGSTGGFSDFIIVKDITTAVVDLSTEALEMYDELESDLKGDDLSASASALMRSELDVSQAAFQVNDLGSAIASLDRVLEHTRRYAGRDVPNVWVAGSPVVDDAGELIAIASALRFTLRRLNGESP